MSTDDRFETAFSAASPYTSGKVLDTLSELNGDTLLSHDSVAEVNLEAIQIAEDNLQRYIEDKGMESNGSSDNVAAEIRLEIIKRRKLELELVRLAWGQVTGETDGSTRIHDIEKELHDYYSPALFKSALKKKIEVLENIKTPIELDVAKAVLLEELDDYLASIDTDEDVELEQPKPETLNAIGDWLYGQFGDVIDEVDRFKGDELDAYQLASVLNMAIASTPALRDNGWTVKVIKRNKQAITVFASSREVVVPEQRRITKVNAKKVTVHEVFGHALRSAIAETNGDDVGVRGTARYAEFEESLMIALEQCLDAKYDPGRGVDHYVAVGFVETLGLPRDKVAQLFRAMTIFTEVKNKDKLTNDHVEEADAKTKKQIGRTFAGLTDVDDGIARRTDLKYLHGLNNSWNLLNAIVDAGQIDEGMRWLLSAKSNPYNPLDQEFMSRYSEMPSSIMKALAV